MADSLDDWVVGIFIMALVISMATTLYALCFHIGQTKERFHDQRLLKKVQNELSNGGGV